MAVKIAEWLTRAKEKIDSLDAELILMYGLGFSDRSFLVSHSDDLIPTRKVDEMLEKRLKGMPMAYILGFREFYGHNFKVNKNVLVPRPETETMITMIKELFWQDNLYNKKIVDVGTGSGCIPITLLLELMDQKISIIGLDISESALKVAKDNAEKYQVLAEAEDDFKNKVRFLHADLLSEIEVLPDIITANLPYVDRGWDWTSKELIYEPMLALYTEDNGLKLIKKLLFQIHQRKQKDFDGAGKSVWDKKPKRYIFLEADPSQHERIIAFAEQLEFILDEKRDFILKFHY